MTTHPRSSLVLALLLTLAFSALPRVSSVALPLDPIPLDAQDFSFYDAPTNNTTTNTTTSAFDINNNDNDLTESILTRSLRFTTLPNPSFAVDDFYLPELPRPLTTGAPGAKSDRARRQHHQWFNSSMFALLSSVDNPHRRAVRSLYVCQLGQYMATQAPIAFQNRYLLASELEEYFPALLGLVSPRKLHSYRTLLQHSTLMGNTPHAERKQICAREYIVREDTDFVATAANQSEPHALPNLNFVPLKFLDDRLWLRTAKRDFRVAARDRSPSATRLWLYFMLDHLVFPASPVPENCRLRAIARLGRSVRRLLSRTLPGTYPRQLSSLIQNETDSAVRRLGANKFSRAWVGAVTGAEQKKPVSIESLYPCVIGHLTDRPAMVRLERTVDGVIQEMRRWRLKYDQVTI